MASGTSVVRAPFRHPPAPSGTRLGQIGAAVLRGRRDLHTAASVGATAGDLRPERGPPALTSRSDVGTSRCCSGGSGPASGTVRYEVEGDLGGVQRDGDVGLQGFVDQAVLRDDGGEPGRFPPPVVHAVPPAAPRPTRRERGRRSSGPGPQQRTPPTFDAVHASWGCGQVDPGTRSWRRRVTTAIYRWSMDVVIGLLFWGGLFAVTLWWIARTGLTGTSRHHPPRPTATPQPPAATRADLPAAVTGPQQAASGVALRAQLILAVG